MAQQSSGGEKKEKIWPENSQTADSVNVLIPVTSQIWGEFGPNKPQPEIGIDSLRSPEIGSKLIDKITNDPQFRELIKRDPVKALADVGVVVPPEIEEQLEGDLQKDSNFLIDAMLKGQVSDLSSEEVPAVVPVLPIVGIQVVKYVGVVVAVRTRAEAINHDEA